MPGGITVAGQRRGLTGFARHRTLGQTPEALQGSHARRSPRNTPDAPGERLHTARRSRRAPGAYRPRCRTVLRYCTRAMSTVLPRHTLTETPEVARVLDAADVHHERAVRVVLDHPEHRLAMPSVTVVEALVRHAAAGVGQEAWDALTDLGVEVVENAQTPLALATVRAQAPVKMPDCIVLHAAERTGEPVATFDDRLADVAHQRGAGVVGSS